MADQPASEGERCGRCGADASSGDGLVCPACGALLAAYRDPASVPVRDASPPSPAVVPVSRTSRAEPPRESAGPAAFVGIDPDPPFAERAVSVTTDPEPVAAEPAPGQPERPVGLPEPRLDRDPGGSPRQPPVAAPRRYEAAEPRPRPPGFVTAGTVEPVILYGGIALLLGCVFIGLASQIGGRAIAALGFLLAVVGVVAIAVALLVTLVRRESERR